MQAISHLAYALIQLKALSRDKHQSTSDFFLKCWSRKGDFTIY